MSENHEATGAVALADAVAEQVSAWRPGVGIQGSVEVFEDLAWNAARHQFETIGAYRNLWLARGAPTPSDDVRAHGDWRATPAVPTRAFKEEGLRLYTASPRVVFRSSGTTLGGERRSVHRHPHPDLYRRIVDASFPTACLDDTLCRNASRVPVLSLIPSLDEAPDSSLSFMIDHAMKRWASECSIRALTRAGLDEEAARAFLEARARERRPVLVMTTALALTALLDVLASRPLEHPLPEGSVIFETGGFKGRERELSRRELVVRAGAVLGVDARRIVREYGMTELTSQAYTRVLAGGDPDTFHTPPWLFWRIVDPETGAEVEVGREGLLCFFDLGNAGSVCHVLTEDVGRATPDGGFELLGRAADAELRGCSLTAEELLR